VITIAASALAIRRRLIVRSRWNPGVIPGDHAHCVESNAMPRPLSEPNPFALTPSPRPLPRAFFARPADAVAPELLGCWLLSRPPKRDDSRAGRRTMTERTANADASLAEVEAACWVGGPIVEVEAYLRDDPACHAFIGPTARNRVMFGPAGRAYVYFIYGMHHCVNAVCNDEGVGEAVLIRAIEPRLGLAEIARRRGRPIDQPPRPDWTAGPGRVCAALGIGLGLNGADLADADSPLVIVGPPAASLDRRTQCPETRDGSPITVTPRIGITKGADAPLRFLLSGHRFVSGRRGPASD
jgi:DNA-3-methyladenine glycosylase